MREISVWRRVILGVLLAASFSYAHAVDVTGRIKGVVTDPTGAVVPNATITATNTATGVVSTTTSSATGDYRFQTLSIGTYSITVTAAGFKSFSASGIALNIDQEYNEPVKLSIGSSSDTISVEANAVQVDTSSMQLGNVVQASQIVELPLIGRAFTQLEQISPGIQSASDRFTTAYSANGAQSQQSSYLLNGTDVNDLPLNTISFQPNVDALAEYNLITSSLNPEYSRNSGAIVSATIKNGTNHFHGDAFEFYRDTFLNNRSYFQKTAPVFHQNLFGGTLGGPILKDKLFFFAAYQGNRARQPQTQNNNTVYTSAQLGGDFSTVAITAAAAGHKVPSTVPIPGCPTGTTFGSCFGYNSATGRYTKAIPTAAYNSIASALIQKYVPPPNSGTNIFTYTGTTTIIQDQGIGRIDYNPTQKDSFWALVIMQHAPSLNTIPFSGATVPGFGDGSGSEIKQYAVSYTRQLSVSAVNVLSLHYNRFNFNSGQPQQVSLPSSYGFAITPADASSAGLPTMSVGGTGGFTLGSSSNGPQPRIDQTYQASDNFSKTIGRHSLKFGYDGRKFLVLNNFDAKNSGSFAFTNTNNQGTGNALIDFALGIPNAYTQSTSGQINAYAFETYIYGQDTWRATNELTLTLGAGYQIDTALHNRQYNGIGVTCYTNGQVSKIFPTAPKGLNYPGDPGCNDASGAKTNYHNVGPRIGFAYSPNNLGFISGGPGKFSIRGGFGLYYNRSEEETSLNNLNDPPYGLTSGGATDYASLGATKPSFANPFKDLSTGTVYANKFPAPVPQPGQAINFGPYEPIDVSQYDPRFRIPYAMNFNLTMEREFPSQIVARLSYVGALGRHNQMYNEGNPITAAGRAACLLDKSCANPATQFADDSQTLDFPSHFLYGNTDIFPSIGLVQSEGTSNYNSLQLSATKGTTHGLAFQLSYTYAHSLDDASSYEGAGYGGSNGRGYNQYNKTLNYGSSTFDARNRFVIAPVYSVPYHEGGNMFLNLLASGWGISGIQTFAQGFPYDISYGGGVSYSLYCSANTAFYACPDIPQQIAPLKLFNPRTRTASIQSQWFSGASFADEAIGTFGNIGRNTYHGPGKINTDAAITKNFRYMPDDATKIIQLRLEAYNVFNHTNFNLPDGNIGNSTFGHITGSSAGRQVQLAGKIYF